MKTNITIKISKTENGYLIRTYKQIGGFLELEYGQKKSVSETLEGLQTKIATIIQLWNEKK